MKPEVGVGVGCGPKETSWAAWLEVPTQDWVALILSPVL